VRSKRIIGMVLLAMVASLVFASVAVAAVSQETIDAIMADAQDGTLDGNWTEAQVQAALDWFQNSPLAQQYGGNEDVLEDFLSGSDEPGDGGGSLSFTGANLPLAFGIGIALMGAGLLVRRKLTSD